MFLNSLIQKFFSPRLDYKRLFDVLNEKYEPKTDLLQHYVGKHKTVICEVLPSCRSAPPLISNNFESRTYLEYRDNNQTHVFILDNNICTSVLTFPDFDETNENKNYNDTPNTLY